MHSNKNTENRRKDSEYLWIIQLLRIPRRQESVAKDQSPIPSPLCREAVVKEFGQMQMI